MRAVSRGDHVKEKSAASASFIVRSAGFLFYIAQGCFLRHAPRFRVKSPRLTLFFSSNGSLCDIRPADAKEVMSYEMMDRKEPFLIAHEGGLTDFKRRTT